MLVKKQEKKNTPRTLKKLRISSVFLLFTVSSSMPPTPPSVFFSVFLFVCVYATLHQVGQFTESLVDDFRTIVQLPTPHLQRHIRRQVEACHNRVSVYLCRLAARPAQQHMVRLLHLRMLR